MKDEKGKLRNLASRTKAFALRVIKLYAALPKSIETQIIGKQILKSGTSVGAHYRESIRARSDAEFISKLEGGMQELEETCYWLELIVESGFLNEKRVIPLISEANELMAIFVTIVKNTKRI